MKLLGFIWNVIFTKWRNAFNTCGGKEAAVTWRPMLELNFKIAAELKEGKVCMDLRRDTLFIHSIHKVPIHTQAVERSPQVSHHSSRMRSCHVTDEDCGAE